MLARFTSLAKAPAEGASEAASTEASKAPTKRPPKQPEDAPASLVEAKMRARISGCSRIRANPNGRYRTPKGEACDIVPFGTWATPLRELYNFGCPVAVELFLDFHVGVTAAFALMMLIAIYPAIDNQQRREARISCRAALPDAPPECGYAGLDIRGRKRMPNASSIASLSLGSCEEYAGYNSTLVQPVGPPSLFTAVAHNASFCLDRDAPDVHAWLALPLVMLWLVFLVLWTKRQRHLAARHDLAVLSAADYAVMVSGLPAHQEEKEVQLEARLRHEVTRTTREPPSSPPRVPLSGLPFPPHHPVVPRGR